MIGRTRRISETSNASVFLEHRFTKLILTCFIIMRLSIIDWEAAYFFQFYFVLV